MLNVASNEEGEWSSVGPSDCCDPPRNLPPVALLGQKGYHVDSVVIAAPDVDVEVFLAGLDSNMSPSKHNCPSWYRLHDDHRSI